MRKKNVNSEYIKGHITEALLKLMDEKPFDKISISEIVEKAGVGRASFYRHFESKEQILVEKIHSESLKWWYSFDTEIDKTNQENYILRMFYNALSMKDVGSLLYKNHMSYLIMDALNELMGPRENDSNKVKYEKASLVGATFGIIYEWMKRGMTDTPEEMSKMIPTHIVENALIPSFPIFEIKKAESNNEIQKNS